MQKRVVFCVHTVTITTPNLLQNVFFQKKETKSALYFVNLEYCVTFADIVKQLITVNIVNNV
jgi:hypothetical protein